MKAFAETSATIKDLRDKVVLRRRLLPADQELFLLGSHTASTSRSARRSGRCSTRLDGVNNPTDQFDAVTKSLDKLNALQPQLLALIPQQLELVEQQIQSQETNKDLAQANYATQTGLFAQQQKALENPTRWARRSTTRRTTAPSTSPRGVRQRRVQTRPGTVPFTDGHAAG